MGYQTDDERRAELAAVAMQIQSEAGMDAVCYIIEDYHEPTNQRRKGYWEEVARVKYNDARTLPAIWKATPGRKRLVQEDKTIIVTEDFGQSLEIICE
jgi:hypothetical protein